MSEIKLHKRVKYAGDVHAELLKLGWDCETVALFCDNIPDADAVEVVRCKDCKWYSSGLCNLYIGFTPSMKPKDFCSCGKRRKKP